MLEQDTERMRLALLRLIWRNAVRSDGQAYDLMLALWGLGLRDEMPQADAFGLDGDFDIIIATEYAHVVAKQD